ncbi:hypothetical protein JCM6882_003679 [Rhodosporidiobolus microsporus]
MTTHGLLARSLGKRDVATDAGQKLKDWVADWSPASAFVVAIAACFFCFCVLIAIVWETIRLCRARARARYSDEQWYQRPDGSSVFLPNQRGSSNNNGGGLTYLGPMGSLVREGRADRSGQGYGYVPAHHGSTPREMLGQANSMSGRFEAYDPPPVPQQRYSLQDQPQGGVYPPVMGGARPASVGTVESGWSGNTRIGNASGGEKKSEVDLQSTAPDFGKNENPLFLPYQPLPPSSQPSPAPTPRPAAFPVQQPDPPSVVGSFDSGRTSLPLPNAPRTPKTSTHTPSPLSGESAFSTPKPAATPVSNLSSSAPPPHTRTHSFPTPGAPSGFVPSHARGASGGFTPKPLGLSSLSSSPPSGGAGGFIGRSSSLGSSVTTPEPPKVDLKRTWSIGTWALPGLRKQDLKDDDEETATLVGKAEGK